MQGLLSIRCSLDDLAISDRANRRALDEANGHTCPIVELACQGQGLCTIDCCWLFAVGAVVDAAQSGEDVDLPLPISHASDEFQGPLVCRYCRLIFPEKFKSGRLLGMEARYHTRVGGGGHLLCGLQSTYVVRLGFH